MALCKQYVYLLWCKLAVLEDIFFFFVFLLVVYLLYNYPKEILFEIVETFFAGIDLLIFLKDVVHFYVKIIAIIVVFLFILVLSFIDFFLGLDNFILFLENLCDFLFNTFSWYIEQLDPANNKTVHLVSFRYKTHTHRIYLNLGFFKALLILLILEKCRK